jgi:Tfp pilus assembly protein PilF
MITLTNIFSSYSWYERAAEEYRKALKFEPRNTNCMGDLHKCLLEVELSGAAGPNVELIRKERLDLSRQIDEAKRNESESERLRLEAMENAKNKQAVSQYCKQLSFDPCNTHALLGRAKTYEKLGEIEKAVADLRLACRLDPDNKELQEIFRLAKSRSRNTLS